MLRRALVFALTLTTSGVWSSLTFRVRQCPTHAETAVEQKRRNRGRYAATRRATSSLNHAAVWFQLANVRVTTSVPTPSITCRRSQPGSRTGIEPTVDLDQTR
jgi:hypothetical protein